MGWERNMDARRAYWEQFGQMSETAWFGPTNGPMSRWPGFAENFVPVVTPTTGIITTDGISAPHDEEDADDHGDAMEFFIESAELTGPTTDWSDSFLLRVIVQAGMNYGGNDFRPTFDAYRVLTLRLIDSGAPEDWLTQDGLLGLLVGVPVAGRPSHIEVGEDAEAILLAAVTPLRPSELAWTLETQDREGMAAKLVEAGYGHVFDRSRPALV